jgi:acyl-CoA dehydrogenase
MDDMLENMAARLLADRCTPALIRAVEAGSGGDQLAKLWQEILATGLCDSLVDEAKGGSGLGLTEVLPVILQTGRFILPIALAETMVSRALLAAGGVTLPEGPIVLATAVSAAGAERVETAVVPLAATAGFALIDDGKGCELFALAPADLVRAPGRGSLSAQISVARSATLGRIAAPATPLRAVAALLHAAKLSGAMKRLLEMTVDYGNTRVQFGRPIGKFQAIQHQLAVMAEQVSAAAIAVEAASPARGYLPDPLPVAVAKERTSAAAVLVGGIAHAVHGAMGISEEYDLQLFTRRLQDWRTADGSESYWAGLLGRAVLAEKSGSVIDFIRTRLTN